MNRVAHTVQFIRRIAPYLILIVALIATILVMVLGFWAFIGPVLGALIGGTLGVGNRLWGSHVDLTFQSRPLEWRIPAIVTSCFVLSMIVMYRPVLGYRPLAHYGVLGAMAGFLAYEIYVGQSRRQILPQITVFFFLTYWSTQFIFPLGANAPDTAAFIPAINSILETNHISSNFIYSNTPGHMIYVASVVEITGLDTLNTYHALSILALVTTVILVGYLDQVVESINDRTALYASLFFGIMGFTFRRGLFPNKMNFFKPLILIVVITTFALAFARWAQKPYTILGIISILALVVGHTYSMGAAVMIITTIWAFNKLSRAGKKLDYVDSFPIRPVTAFVFTGITVLMGYSLTVKGSIIRRLSSITISVLAFVGYYGGPATGGSSGGRYSELSLELLFFSTAGQFILFVLGVAGISAAFRYRDWAYDVITAWIAFGIGMLALSVFINAVDIPTPRIYSLIGMFGLNIMMVVGLILVTRAFSKSRRPSAAAIIIAVFAVLSFSSPVASVTLSPVGDQVPHVRQFETAPNAATTEWVNGHMADEYLTSQVARTKLPMQKIGSQSATIDTARIQEDAVYIYTDLARETGVISDSDSPSLGGRRYVFLEQSPQSKKDNLIYTNRESKVYRRTDVFVERE